MAISDNNPAGVPDVGPTVSHPVFRSEHIRSWTTGELADDATYTIPLAEDGEASGLYICRDAGDQNDLAFFAVQASGTTVSAVDIGPSFGSHNWDDADTDTKYCLFVSSGDLVLRNRVGSAATLEIAKVF